MSQVPVPPRGGSPGPAYRDVAPASSEPAWVRPTVIFLLGLLLGALVIAGTRPLTQDVGHRTDTTGSSSVDPSCDQVITDSQHIAELADRAADAAQRHDATSLSSLARELRDSESTLDRDVPSCHS